MFTLLAVGALMLASSSVQAHDHHHGGFSHGSSFSLGLGFGGYGYGYGWPGYYGSGYGYYPSYSGYYGYAPYTYTVPGRVVTSRVYDDGYSVAMDVQRELARRGYYYGSIDGVIGPVSRTAIARFQASHGMAATGNIDGRLLRSLGLS